MRFFIIVAILLTSCHSNIKSSNEQELSIESKISISKLESIVIMLQEQTVHGYVLIHYSAFEYSSLDKARKDASSSKAIVCFDTDRFDLHTPKSVDIGKYYNWGSPLIFRKVIKDHGDVVEVLTMDQDLPESIGHWGRGADYVFELITFIRKIDLVPVINETFKTEYSDETSITLLPGEQLVYHGTVIVQKE